MRHLPNQSLKCFILLVLALCASSSHADSANLTETQTDKVNCRAVRVDGQRRIECTQNTTGAYRINAFVSAETFMSFGVYDADEDTPLGIRVGDFEHQGTLANAHRRTLARNRVSGTWLHTRRECRLDTRSNRDICRNVTDATISIDARVRGATIRASGKSFSAPQPSHGQSVFAKHCQERRSGESFREIAVIKVGTLEIPGTIEVNCRQVRTRTITARDGRPYTLTNMTINARLIPEQLVGAFDQH